MRTRALRSYGTHLLHYQSELTLGFPSLRRTLATYLRESRGVQCDWHQVAITTGSQQALYLLAHLLLRPESRVAMEDPGYLGARFAWQRTGARLIPVSIDAEGMRLPPDKRFSARRRIGRGLRRCEEGRGRSGARRLAGGRRAGAAGQGGVRIQRLQLRGGYGIAHPPVTVATHADSSTVEVSAGSTFTSMRNTPGKPASLPPVASASDGRRSPARRRWCPRWALNRTAGSAELIEADPLREGLVAQPGGGVRGRSQGFQQRGHPQGHDDQCDQHFDEREAALPAHVTCSLGTWTLILPWRSGSSVTVCRCRPGPGSTGRRSDRRWRRS